MDYRAPSSLPPSPTASARNDLDSEPTPRSDHPAIDPASSHSDDGIPRSSHPSPPHSTTHPRPATGAGAGLNEFRSLLEAAQRIADGASFGPDNGTWPDDEQAVPVIRRSTAADDLPRSVPPTRLYSGRPHVPGEDSGSEAGDTSQEVPRPQIAAMNEEGQEGSHLAPQTDPRDDFYSLVLSDPDHGQYRDHEREIEAARQALQRAAARQRARRELSEERLRRREEIVARSRERIAAQERVRAHLTEGHERTPLYDWGPEPENVRPSSAVSETRARSSSVRRWRPSERLQDYASSHARQESLNDGNGYDPPTADTPSQAGTIPARSTVELRDHNDIVNRVERALQEYRIARRALRVQQEEAAMNPGPDSGAFEVSATSRDGAYRRSQLSPAVRDANALRHVRDSLDHIYDLAIGERVDLARTGSPSPQADRSRRDESLRQRVRDQARERRRRLVSTMLEHDGGIATGPLFGRSFDRDEPHDADRWRANTRSMLDKVRRAEARAKSKELKQAKAALRYLASLRDPDMDPVKAWTLASEVGLHNQGLTAEEKQNLPLSVDDLPRPAHCSWLEPGTTWIGTQSADEPETRRTQRARTVWEAVRRAREQRDRVDIVTRQNESFRMRMRQEQSQEPLERTPVPSRSQNVSPDDFLSVARNSMQVLEDAERDLSTMLERSERLLRENERQLRENEQQLARNRESLREHDERLAQLRVTHGDLYSSPSRSDPVLRTRDRWCVKVTLHEVDWERMTVTGTMTASNTPHSQTQSDENTSQSAAETSMDSFFTGEIIDFLNHGLDTIAPADRKGSGYHRPSGPRFQQQQDWKIGGPDIDLTYWAGIGPFKQAIDQVFLSRENQFHDAIRQQELEKLLPDTAITQLSTQDSDKADTQDIDQPRLNDPISVSLTEDEKYDLKLKTMHNLLTDTHWLKENINTKGWILMRWKERCFVSPGSDPNPEPTRPWIPNDTRSSDLSDTALARGWYSFADFYQRRQSERSRIFTTNAAERDEIGDDSSAGQGLGRQPMWGLTISGFYYVAVHRLTGRIEGLYYDCGSAPFQTLKMVPKIEISCREGNDGNEGAVDVDDEEGKRQPFDFGGLRTNFSLVEFR